MVDQNIVNHVGMVMDASVSMRPLASTVVTMADGQVKELADLSTKMDQETRATVYTFGEPDDIQCIYYDKDVLRLPSLNGKYIIRGNTALIDATMKAIEDLEKTATLYGDHAFLLYVWTDGEENRSKKYGPTDLNRKLSSLPDNWTVAALVPNERGVGYARTYGFLAGNIAIWSTTNEGMRAAGATVSTATQQYMQNRAIGIRGSRSLFQASTAQVDTAQLKTLQSHQFQMLLVDPFHGGEPIKNFVEIQTGQPYRKGSAYYQLTKKEEVQPSKDILLMDQEGKVYYGIEARRMIGLPDYGYADVLPENHTKYTIFVRSDSVNRKLVPNTMLILRR